MNIVKKYNLSFVIISMGLNITLLLIYIMLPDMDEKQTSLKDVSSSPSTNDIENISEDEQCIAHAYEYEQSLLLQEMKDRTVVIICEKCGNLVLYFDLYNTCEALEITPDEVFPVSAQCDECGTYNCVEG